MSHPPTKSACVRYWYLRHFISHTAAFLVLLGAPLASALGSRLVRLMIAPVLSVNKCTVRCRSVFFLL